MIFSPEVTTLRQFYESPSGQRVRREIQQKIALFWPNIQHETVVGVGFAIPYLQEIIKASNHVGVFMPAAQGVVHWPGQHDNLCCLSSETCLPLADNSVDKIILVHTLEYNTKPHTVIREMWRVLAPKGKLLVIAPNRLGAWAHFGKTPYHSGRAFHLFELIKLLQDAFFLPLHTGSLLFAPPGSPHILENSSLFEHIGNFWLQPFGGILIAEGEKQLYSATTVSDQKKWSKIRAFLPAME